MDPGPPLSPSEPPAHRRRRHVDSTTSRRPCQALVASPRLASLFSRRPSAHSGAMPRPRTGFFFARLSLFPSLPSSFFPWPGAASKGFFRLGRPHTPPPPHPPSPSPPGRLSVLPSLLLWLASASPPMPARVHHHTCAVASGPPSIPPVHQPAASRKGAAPSGWTTDNAGWWAAREDRRNDELPLISPNLPSLVLPPTSPATVPTRASTGL